MSSPFRNYDAWLTTDTAAEAAEAEAEAIMDAWEQYATAEQLPYEMADEDHPDHGVYQAWENLFMVVDGYRNMLLAKQEAADYEAEEQAQAEWEQMQENHRYLTDLDTRVEADPGGMVWRTREPLVGCVNVMHNEVDCRTAGLDVAAWCSSCRAHI